MPLFATAMASGYLRSDHELIQRAAPDFAMDLVHTYSVWGGQGVEDRRRKLEGTNRGRTDARGAKPLWVSSRHPTRTTCVPCFSAPLLAYARDRRPHAMVMTGRCPVSIAQTSCGETVRPAEARVAHAGAGHGEENHRTTGRESIVIQSATLGTPMSCPSRWIHVLCVCHFPSREAVPVIYCCSNCRVRGAGELVAAPDDAAVV